MNQYRIRFSALEWDRPMEGVRQKAITEGNQKIRLVEYSPTLPLHWCEKGHCGYILEGRLEVEFKSGAHIFEPGDGVFIPDGSAHRHRARVLSPLARAIFVENA
jgi:quercetin dioxygenase-like cupin family protein